MVPLEQANWDPGLARFFKFVKTNCVLEVVRPGDLSTPPETRSFMPIDRVQKYFSDLHCLELKHILGELFPPGDPVFELVLPGDVLPKYVAVFCTLLFCGHGRYIEQFRQIPSLSDVVLPLDPQNPPAIFPDAPGLPDFFRDFCKEQWRFCVPVFDSVADTSYEQDRVLPITFRRKLGGVGVACLWEIEIFPSYNKLVIENARVSIV